MSDEADIIRASIEERVLAIRAKDADALMRGYASDVIAFDLLTPLTNAGITAVRRRVKEWFASFQSPIQYELRNLQLQVDGHIACDHHLVYVGGRSVGGDAVSMWFRETIFYRKIDGRWLVTHQHSSVPIDMPDGTPRFDLQP